MKTKTNEPTITKKYHIEVPTHQYMSVPTVYKVWFGKHYLIWKGKSLLQSCEFLAEGIERYIRLKKNEDTDYLYYVCRHIVKTRCLKATIEVIANDFQKEDSEAINGLKMLKLEQELLDKATDEYCLNNNSEAYIPGWVNKAHVEKFEKWLKDRRKK
jgi:hypothetical protein